MTVDNMTFHDTITTTGNGLEYNIDIKDKNEVLTIYTSGTSSSRTIVFEHSQDKVTWLPIVLVNLGTLATATQTTGIGESWQLQTTGLMYFRTRVSVIAGGNLTVKGVLK